MRRPVLTGLSCVLAAATPAIASQTLYFSDPSGLAAEAEFSLLSSTMLEIRLRNTSTGVPAGFDSADQLLTSISWDFGEIGINGSDPQITSGVVRIGMASQTLNFSTGIYNAHEDVSGEFGFGNGGTTGLKPNYVSAMAAGTTPFGGPNLDGPANLDGPQGGLVANPPVVSLGGLGAIQDEVVMTVTVSTAIADLGFLNNQVTVEFGSDAAFLTVPEPSSLALLVGGVVTFGLRGRSR